MSNATCFVRGSIHQGDSQFSNISRGRQCSFMSLLALLCANSCDILTWTSDIIDRIPLPAVPGLLLLYYVQKCNKVVVVVVKYI